MCEEINYDVSVFIDSNIYIDIFLKNFYFSDSKELYALLNHPKINFNLFSSKIVFTEVIDKLNNFRKEIIDLLNQCKPNKNLASIFGKFIRKPILEVNKENFTKFISDFKSFYKLNTTELDYISINKENVQTILNQYFNKKFPFSNEKNTKKYEFPDAFIIQQLENWLNDENDNDKSIYLVTKDNEMFNYFSESILVRCFKSLDSLIDHHNKQLYPLISETISNIFKAPSNELIATIKESFKNLIFEDSDYFGDTSLKEIKINQISISSFELLQVNEFNREEIRVIINSNVFFDFECTLLIPDDEGLWLNKYDLSHFCDSMPQKYYSSENLECNICISLWAKNDFSIDSFEFETDTIYVSRNDY